MNDTLIKDLTNLMAAWEVVRKYSEVLTKRDTLWGDVEGECADMILSDAGRALHRRCHLEGVIQRMQKEA